MSSAQKAQLSMIAIGQYKLYFLIKPRPIKKSAFFFFASLSLSLSFSHLSMTVYFFCTVLSFFSLSHCLSHSPTVRLPSLRLDASATAFFADQRSVSSNWITLWPLAGTVCSLFACLPAGFSSLSESALRSRVAAIASSVAQWALHFSVASVLVLLSPSMVRVFDSCVFSSCILSLWTFFSPITFADKAHVNCVHVYVCVCVCVSCFYWLTEQFEFASWLFIYFTLASFTTLILWLTTLLFCF